MKFNIYCLRLDHVFFFLCVWPVKPLPVQLKKGNDGERSRNIMTKRLHSDLESDEDLEDNTTKDEGWIKMSFIFIILVHSRSNSLSLFSFLHLSRRKNTQNYCFVLFLQWFEHVLLHMVLFFFLIELALIMFSALVPVIASETRF